MQDVLCTRNYNESFIHMYFGFLSVWELEKLEVGLSRSEFLMGPTIQKEIYGVQELCSNNKTVEITDVLVYLLSCHFQISYRLKLILCIVWQTADS